MNKEQQIAEMAKIIFDYVDNLKQKHVYVLGNDTAKEMREYSHNQGIAEALYIAGYRKVSTSSLANEIQKAYKEGYEKGFEQGFNGGCKNFYRVCKEYASDCKANGYDGIGENDIDDLLERFLKGGL